MVNWMLVLVEELPPYKYYRGTTLLRTSNNSSVTLAFGCNGGVLKVEAQSSCGTINKSTTIPQQCNNYYRFSIYPNPTLETLTIKRNEKKSYQKLASSKSRSSRSLDNSSFELYGYNSSLIHRGIISNQTNIDVSNYKKGRYILKIYKNKKSETHHIII